MNWKKTFKIDPLLSFIELPILWIFVSILFIVALLISIIIIVNSNLSLSLDYTGFNSFVEIFKVPLGILAIIITYSAFLATIHRSIQTKEQLIITNRQNTFSNYFKHIEEYEKYVSSVFPNDAVNIVNVRTTYNYLFPKSFEGDYSINKCLLDTIEIEFMNIKKQLELFNQQRYESVFGIFNEAFKCLQRIRTLIGIRIEHPNCRQVVQNGEKLLIPDYNLQGAFSVILREAKIYKKLLSFDHLMVFPKTFEEVLSINLTVIPDCSFEIQRKLERFNVFTS